jgi:transposase
MTKTEQNRVLAWRLKVLGEAGAAPRNVAQACRHFGLSRKSFYKWKARYEAHGEAGLCDQPRTPHHSPRATPREVVSKILYLRQGYHFGAGRIADYLKRFHRVKIARSTVHRILDRHGLKHASPQWQSRTLTPCRCSGVLPAPGQRRHCRRYPPV